MNQIPTNSETAPGTMNAARQLIASLSDAATIAAAARPRFPATPLMPEQLADLVPPLDQHGDADRVIDRREEADQREPDRELERVCGRTR